MYRYASARYACAALCIVSRRNWCNAGRYIDNGPLTTFATIRRNSFAVSVVGQQLFQLLIIPRNLKRNMWDEMTRYSTFPIVSQKFIRVWNCSLPIEFDSNDDTRLKERYKTGPSSSARAYLLACWQLQYRICVIHLWNNRSAIRDFDNNNNDRSNVTDRLSIVISATGQRTPVPWLDSVTTFVS